MRLSTTFAIFFALMSLFETVDALQGRGQIRGARKYKDGSKYFRRLKDDKSGDKDDKDDKDDGDGGDGDGGIIGDDGDLGLDADLIADVIEAVGCFSEVATVQLQDRETPVAMKDLQVNDRVLTEDGSYQEVYGFAHKDLNKEAIFYQFHTSATANPLEMTGEHLVFLQDKYNPVRADSVKVGDYLQGTTKDAQVIRIEHVERTGVYTPLTANGKIVVDGVQSSSYVSLQDGANVVKINGKEMPMSQQDFVHMAFSPLRMVCQGISASACDTNNENGMPSYVTHGLRFTKWAEEQPLLLQVVLLGLALAVFGTSMFFENTFGTSTPSLALAAVGLYCAVKLSGVTLRARKVKTA